MFEYFIYTYGVQIMGAILCAIFGLPGLCYEAACSQIPDRWIQTRRCLCGCAGWTTIHGTDKLNKALETAEALLKKKGIDFDADEMEILIEAAVAEFNKTFKSTPLTEESTADAVRRVEME